MPNTPIIPTNITVHLGRPQDAAQNITLPFPEYIKNVASSEIYPTWPESAIRANIYAQISYTLNRVYTEFYRSQGYPFDITSSTAYDQSFVYGREIFDNISQIVDEIFNSYIRRQGSVAPLFSAYCDGVEVSCGGLSQWGTVSLARAGLTPYEILQNYYGDDIDIVSGVPVGNVNDSAPAVPLQLGQANPNVELVQTRLNRISRNYPAIPKISPVDGFFGSSTEDAVLAFQRIFGLTQDGIVGSSTWYRILYIYNGVKRLSELNAEGLSLSEVSSQYPSLLSLGSSGDGVRYLQYYLDYIANFVPTVSSVAVDGFFGEETQRSVISFQNTYSLTPDGVVGELTWNTIYNVYLGLVSSLPLSYTEGLTVPFPGKILTLGSEGEDVLLLQEYLRYLAGAYPQIPMIEADGVFGESTQNAVIAFQDLFGIDLIRGSVGLLTWNAITSAYDDVYNGNLASQGQYPGAPIS
ncbi:MAG: peptidoglycan-binding protein [Clostridia bacterium]|nr:peptidoglycan-binding protein [Clostridia bacterium]